MTATKGLDWARIEGRYGWHCWIIHPASDSWAEPLCDVDCIEPDYATIGPVDRPEVDAPCEDCRLVLIASLP